MPDAVKCQAGGAFADPQGNPALEANAKEYQKLLDKNCADIHESAACFAEEARKYNKLIDELHQIGEEPIVGSIPDGLSLNETLETFPLPGTTNEELEALKPKGGPGATREEKLAALKDIHSGAQTKRDRDTQPARDVARLGTRCVGKLRAPQKVKWALRLTQSPEMSLKILATQAIFLFCKMPRNSGKEVVLRQMSEGLRHLVANNLNLIHKMKLLFKD